MPVEILDDVEFGAGQGDLDATTLTAVYTSPALERPGRSVKSIFVCNRNSTPSSFRISYAPAGAADSDEQYLYYDVPIAANDTFMVEFSGLRLNPNDEIRVYVADANFSATVFVE